MDAKLALDTVVRPKLEDTFGKSVAMLIIMTATASAGVPTVDLSKDDYLALVRALVKDERVTNMWGSAGAQSQLSQWEREVD